MKFVPKGPINNNPALVQIMAWSRSGDKPLSEPMMVSLLTHICVTRPQWVNLSNHHAFSNAKSDVSFNPAPESHADILLGNIFVCIFCITLTPGRYMYMQSNHFDGRKGTVNRKWPNPWLLITWCRKERRNSHDVDHYAQNAPFPLTAAACRICNYGQRVLWKGLAWHHLQRINGQVRLGSLVRNYFSVRTILNSTGCCK